MYVNFNKNSLYLIYNLIWKIYFYRLLIYGHTQNLITQNFKVSVTKVITRSEFRMFVVEDTILIFKPQNIPLESKLMPLNQQYTWIIIIVQQS